LVQVQLATRQREAIIASQLGHAEEDRACHWRPSNKKAAPRDGLLIVDALRYFRGMIDPVRLMAIAGLATLLSGCNFESVERTLGSCQQSSYSVKDDDQRGYIRACMRARGFVEEPCKAMEYGYLVPSCYKRETWF
jgi:hypothetical protein